MKKNMCLNLLTFHGLRKRANWPKNCNFLKIQKKILLKKILPWNSRKKVWISHETLYEHKSTATSWWWKKITKSLFSFKFSVKRVSVNVTEVSQLNGLRLQRGLRFFCWKILPLTLVWSGTLKKRRKKVLKSTDDWVEKSFCKLCSDSKVSNDWR